MTPDDPKDLDVSSSHLDRRGFVTWLTRGSLAAATALAIGQVVRFLSFEPPSSSTTIISVGSPKDYPRGTLTYMAEARVYVGHDRQGLYALDAVCTHLGCLVEQKEEGGFVCPCHGSHFDPQGQAETGPATKPLRYLELWPDPQDGQLVVDRAKPVGSSTRLTL
jgi:cytochrome b6-f complex iron-sulfur subunit